MAVGTASDAGRTMAADHEGTAAAGTQDTDRRVVLGCDDCALTEELTSASADFVHRVSAFFRQHAEHATSGKLPD